MTRSRLPVVSVLLLCLLSVCFPVLSLAQSNATLHGTVTDPSGAVVVGAKVYVYSCNVDLVDLGPHHQISQEWWDQLMKSSPRCPGASARTSADGTYSVTLPAAPNYAVNVLVPGFSSFNSQVDLAAEASRVFDIHLRLLPMSSSVVVSAEAVPRQAVDVAAPVDVITRDDIQGQQQAWLTPLLATVPGIAFSQLGPGGGTVSLFLDGGNSNYTRVLVDGVPADVSLSGISFDPSDFSSDAVDKIEVVHGAASALYGSDAMTGVVEILTHRGSTRTPLLELEGDGGTFGTGHGSGQLSGLLGKFDYSASAGYFSTRGQSPGAYVLATDGPQTYPYFRDTTLAGNFGWKFSDTDTLRLTLRNSASDAGTPGQTLLASNPSVLFNPVNAGEDLALHDFSSGLTWDFSTGEHWATRLQSYDSRLRLDIPEFSVTDKFNRAGLDARTSYFFSRTSATAGYSFENETGGVGRRHDQAGYLELHRRFTRRLAGVLGGRVEANDSYGTHVVPRVGASYALRQGADFWGPTVLRASFGQGIKEPPLFPQGCTPILKPEQSTTFDAGFDQSIASDRLRFSATFFHNDFRDIVSFASGAMPNNQPQNCQPFFGSFFNTDKARAYGVDSSFQWKALRWLTVAGTYSYDDSLVEKAPFSTDRALLPGNRLLKRPLNSANLLFNAHFRRVDWNATGYFVGTRTDSDFLGLETPITRDPGYVRWDTSSSLRLVRGVSFTAHIENLFDKHYSDAVGYPALGYNYRLGLRFLWGGDR